MPYRLNLLCNFSAGRRFPSISLRPAYLLPVIRGENLLAGKFSPKLNFVAKRQIEFYPKTNVIY